MPAKEDRVGQLLEGIRHRRKTLVSPEGVTLDLNVANISERLGAFCLDIAFMFTAILVLYLVFFIAFFSGYRGGSVGFTLVMFLAFIIRNLYFIHFEMAWQGRTPGKRICGLRVINRYGGELTPSAIIARNITREVEFFLPFSLFLRLTYSGSFIESISMFGWVVIIAILPLFNKERLRAGDLLAGTIVISIPKRKLLMDIAEESKVEKRSRYSFTHEQLSVYGAYELQVLEELLRRKDNKMNNRTIIEVAQKIARKINWQEPIAKQEVYNFLTDFYTAERAELERGQLFGKFKEDKFAGIKAAGE